MIVCVFNIEMNRVEGPPSLRHISNTWIIDEKTARLLLYGAKAIPKPGFGQNVSRFRWVVFELFA